MGNDGDFEVVYAERNKYPFVFKRGQFIVCVNPSSEETEIDFDYEVKEVVYTIGTGCVENKKLKLMPQSFGIMKV